MEAEQKQVSSQNSTSFILATCTPRPHLLPSTRRTFYPGIIRFRAGNIALFVFWSLFGDCPSAGAVTEPFRPPFFPQPSWVRHLPPKQTEIVPYRTYATSSRTARTSSNGRSSTIPPSVDPCPEYGCFDLGRKHRYGTTLSSPQRLPPKWALGDVPSPNHDIR